MIDFTLKDVTTADYNTYEAELIQLLNEQFPTLDVRKGTVLRELLVKPAAQVYALDGKRFEELKRQFSLLTMSQHPEDVDLNILDGILSNFNVSRNSGTYATGKILVKVAYSIEYVISSNETFSTSDSNIFRPAKEYKVKLNDADIDNDTNIKLYTSADGTYYYFILDAISDMPGSKYNIVQGTAINSTSGFYGFVTAEAYSSFTGGIDEETIETLIQRIPYAIANRSLESRLSIASILMDKFSYVRDINAIGMGEAEQLRSKHNVLGIDVGGRVDIYARTFSIPSIITIIKAGTRIAPSTYNIELTEEEFSGCYMIRSITNTEVGTNTLGSYAFVDNRGSNSYLRSFHDFSSNNLVVETAYTKYQNSTVTVYDVVGNSSDTHIFKLEVYTAPNITELQNYVDQDDVKNLFGDIVVRGSLMCLVSLKAYISQKYDSSTIDVEAMRSDIVEFINNIKFNTVLSKSQISSIMHKYPISSVDISYGRQKGMELAGRIRAADGTILTITGDNLNIDTIKNASKLVTSETCIYAADPRDIYLTIVKDSR